MIGEVTAEKRCAEQGAAVGGNRQAGLGAAVTQARHVDGQKGHDECSELVQESAEKKNPGCAWQRPEILSQRGIDFVHRRLWSWTFQHWQQKNPPPFQRWVFKNLVR